jgi:hypothetical protein
VVRAILVMMVLVTQAHAELTVEQASKLAKLPLACLTREYPNKIEHVVNTGADVKQPRDLHPAFYGCLDWHSAVHGHWMLVRLLKTFPALPEAAEIRALIDATITTRNIEIETAYFQAPLRQSFERMYGWAWLLQLHAELVTWNDADAKRWAETLQPLVDEIVARAQDFLPKQTYPIRTGVHPNTAFGLALILDHARATKNAKLEQLVVERATTYFAKDTDYPAKLEPGGEDFFSPALIEADLMRRVLPPAQLAAWLKAFFKGGLPASLQKPAHVSDRSDPKLAHLDGLNLSRAWCLRSLAAALPAKESMKKLFATAADLHATEGLAHVTTGDYAGEHWLATFAVYLQTR